MANSMVAKFDLDNPHMTYPGKKVKSNRISKNSPNGLKLSIGGYFDIRNSMVTKFDLDNPHMTSLG